MTPQEVAALLAYAARLDPRIAAPSAAEADAQLDQWCDLLKDVPATAPHPTGRDWDAAQVVRHHVASSPYPLKPADVSVPWHDFRRDVLGRHTDPTPVADPDNVAAWRAELAGARRAVAAGEAVASTHRQLSGGGPAPAVEPHLAAVGRGIPAEAAAALRPYRPARAVREAAVARGRPDALSVRCEWCHARVDEPCRRRRTGLDGGARGTAPRATPHPGRVDLAAAQQAATT